MKIIVCIKQVPDTNEVRIDPVKGTLIREGVPSILNPDDKSALEEALRMKDENKEVHITVITMGPPQAKEVLFEGIAMGADEGILLSDRAFAGADTWATSNTIAKAIQKIGEYDLIFCGRQAIDGDTAQVGPQIAERLGIPQVSYVQKFFIDGDTVKVHRAMEDGYEVLEAKTPILLTTIKELNVGRYPSIPRIIKAFREDPVKVWTNRDLDIPQTDIGLDGSPTQVKRSFTPEQKGAGQILEGTTDEKVRKLVEILKSNNEL